MAFLDRFRISAKLAMLIGLTMVALAVLASFAMSFIHQRMIDDRVAGLRAIVETVHSTAQGIENQVKAGKLTREAGMDQLRTLIHSMRYGDNEYIFATAFSGISLMHGANPKQEG